MSVKVIIPASGTGNRFGNRVPKQFLKLNGTEIIALTIEKFHSVNLIDEIIISVKKEFADKVNLIVKKNKFNKIKQIVLGGKRRQDSVYNCIKSLSCKKNDIILIHDAVRPFISTDKIVELINAAKKMNSVTLGLPVSETVKKVDAKNCIEKSIDRNNLWIMQTPQAFRYDVLKLSFEKAMKKNVTATDESSIVKNAGYKVKVILGEPENIKITYKQDLKKCQK